MVFKERLAPVQEPGTSNHQKHGFFMTDIDHEQVKLQKEREERKLQKLIQKSTGAKIPEDVEDYLQEKVKLRNAVEE